MEKRKFETMVICSTLNQMVNYVAIKKHGIKNIINITGEENKNDKGEKNKKVHANLKKFNYKEWDKNLKETLGINDFEKNIGFGNYQVKNHNQMIKKLADTCDSIAQPILWNITGGQRHIVMAITEYVLNQEKNDNRKNDVIVYFEGDTEKFLYYGNTKEELSKQIKNDYDCEINIPLAFRLMGMDIKEREEYKTSAYYKVFFEKEKDAKKVDQYEKYMEEYEFYKEFYDKYNQNEKILKISSRSNKDKTDEKKDETKLDGVIRSLKEQGLDRFLNKTNAVDKTNEAIFRVSMGNYKEGKIFGYILEKMAFYKMIEIIKENNLKNIVDIDTSVKINFSDKKQRVSEHAIDEFDIVLVSKIGKVIIFECKSGAMCGDNAKSTHYSTYKVSGVYGTPVLIDPLTNEEWLDEFDKINSAEKAASKAGLIVCRMGSKGNTDEDKGIYTLENYLENVFKNEEE
ncbi:MAG: DNA-binding protein [Marinisporobacter sp.]|jgi:hypothetical protein|nr:DNA-binding protein [Marinisporobacter sp.]